MLHATEVLGGEAYDAQGNFVGRVSELFIEPADQPNRVARYLLGRGKYLPLLARHDQISSVAPGVIKLNVEEKELEHFHPNEAWLAVRKDLLDQQIIDTRGRKVVRVNDVDLAEQRTNGTVELRVTDVDIGLTGATRRLLQGLASPMLIRRIQERLPARTIRWEFVNLIEPDPLRRVKLRITHDKLERMHPADLADIMEELSPAERQAIIASLDEESAAEALAELDSRLTSQIVEKMAPGKAADIIDGTGQGRRCSRRASTGNLSGCARRIAGGRGARGGSAAELRCALGGWNDDHRLRLCGRDGDARRSPGVGARPGGQRGTTRFDFHDRRRRQVVGSGSGRPAAAGSE